MNGNSKSGLLCKHEWEIETPIGKGIRKAYTSSKSMLNSLRLMWFLLPKLEKKKKNGLSIKQGYAILCKFIYTYTCIPNLYLIPVSNLQEKRQFGVSHQ